MSCACSTLGVKSPRILPRSVTHSPSRSKPLQIRCTVGGNEILLELLILLFILLLEMYQAAYDFDLLQNRVILFLCGVFRGFHPSFVLYQIFIRNLIHIKFFSLI